MNGYICLYRKMLDWEWMQEPLTAHLFTCMLLMANSVDGWRYRGIELHAGQFVTSLDKLAGLCGMTPKQVRRRLERLQESGEITLNATNKYTLVTINNYTDYQFENNTDGQTKGTQMGKQRANKNTPTIAAKSDACILAESVEHGNLGKQITQKGANKGQTKGKQDNGANKNNTLNNSLASSYSDTDSPTGQTKGKQENAENEGKQMGKQKANKNDQPSPTDSDVYDNTENSESTEMGKQKGNIQYISINNTIIKKKNKEKKESEFTTQELECMFEDFRKAYKGTKRGYQPEFDNFKKKHQDWKTIVPLLMPALERMNAWREQQQAAGLFLPQIPMLQTWLNQGRWTTEYEITPKVNSNGGQQQEKGQHTGLGQHTTANAQGGCNYEEEF